MTLVRRPLVILAPAALLLVALALTTNVLPLRQILAQRQEIAATQADLDALVSNNEVLAAKVEALQTPAEVERLAREELGYVRPGEKAFVAMDPTPGRMDTSEEAAPVAVEEPVAESRSFFARMWDFVTGRDLVTSG